MTEIYLIYTRSEILGSRIQVLGSRIQVLGSRIQSQDQSQDQSQGPGSASDWFQDRPLRISYLRYTGFKALSVASFILRLTRPRIGYARLLVARNVPNQSTIMDYSRVIYLGHTGQQPLIRP